jgi:hypothetical protein
MGQRHQVQRTLGLKMAAKPADEVRCTYQKQNYWRVLGVRRESLLPSFALF